MMTSRLDAALDALGRVPLALLQRQAPLGRVPVEV